MIYFYESLLPFLFDFFVERDTAGSVVGCGGTALRKLDLVDTKGVR